ncbi:hypothetical protein B7R21_03220 [Subtercola boreus]|uniref:Uncharacterized protein n=1 Tax=Subtercola boreus TaxID=120213 RepID=A0A3E0W162_9MICO|nr:hypothetical protein [Subtercola boreus]RFA15731.1 hypothetical protein B7R21_03220 [Subtercola boreus]
MTSTRTHDAHPDAEDPPGLYALLLGDPVAAAALAAAYDGVHEVLDAVWWSEHPLLPTPGGRPDPAAGLTRLKARAYSRTADESALDELEAFESGLRVEAERLAQAILDARPALEAARERRASALRQLCDETGSGSDDGASRTGSPGGLSAGDGARVSSERPADEAAPAAPAQSPVSAETWRRRSLGWMITSLAAGLLLLVAVGLVVAAQLGSGPFLQTAAGVGPGSAGTGQASAPPGVAGSLPEGLTIFEDPTLAPSILPQNIDPYYKPESLRLLGVADSELTVYAVENRTDQPCLLAVYVDGTQSATCVTKQEFAAMGIELRITSLHIPPAGATASTSAPAADVVFWNADGSFGVTSTPSLRPATNAQTPTPSPTAP